MFTLVWILCVAIIAIFLLGFIFIRLFRRARKIKAFKGAVFWLTSFWLCVIFVVIGLSWGFGAGFLKDFEKTAKEVVEMERVN